MPVTYPHPGIFVRGAFFRIRDFWEREGCLGRCTEMQQLMVESALVRGDVAGATQYLVDWGVTTARHTRISRFDPGTHWYVLDVKFDTLEEAVDHARSHGYLSTSTHVVRARNITGD